MTIKESPAKSGREKSVSAAKVALHSRTMETWSLKYFKGECYEFIHIRGLSNRYEIY